MKNKIILKCFIFILLISIVFSSVVVYSYTQYISINTINSENTSWGIKAMGLDKYMKKMADAENNEEIKVAILDTGINVNHEVFEGRLDLNPIYAKNYVSNNNDLTDTCGRGTAIASIIAESTPSNVKIIPVKVVNTDQAEEAIDIVRIDGIYNALKVLSSEADIICFSLVANPNLLDDILFQSFSEMLNKEVYSVSPNIAIINCVGDILPGDSETRVKFPANFDRIIAVTSVDKDRIVAGNACFGPEVDFAAPGVEVKVASHLDNSSYRIDSSSVYAAAHLSSAYALIELELKQLGLSTTQEDITKILKDNFIDLGTAGKDDYYGYGFVDFRSNMFTGADIDVENKTTNKATVTFDNDNSSTEDFTAKIDAGLVSVTCDIPCYVLITKDGGTTYTALEGIVSDQDENTYNYEFDLEDGLEFVVSIKGDTDFNGIVNGNDAVEIKNLIRSGEVQNLSPLNELLFNLDGEGVVNGNDVVTLKNNIKGTESFTW